MPPLLVVDAFTDRPFAGNPAAVCLLPGPNWPDEGWLQSLAMEMNLSETAFTFKRADGSFPLRWFTPKVEVDLCGHATLAAAHALWLTGTADAGQPIRFDTRSGPLSAVKNGDEIELDFPAKPCVPTDPPPGLLEALGISRPQFVGNNRSDYLIELDSEAAVRSLAPDFRRLAAVPCRGVIATARSSDKNFAFLSRFFAPAVGIDEDPVTGSAHCALAVHWAAKLETNAMLGYQASARGGVVRVTVAGDRVRLGGKAVAVMEGRLSAAVPGS